MLLGGDEVGRSQGGNNNAYCQDNRSSWFDWLAPDEALLEFTRQLIALRKRHPVFRRHRWFQGRSLRGSELRDIAWLKPDAQPMSDSDWETGTAKALQIFINGEYGADPGPRGETITDASFFLQLNGDDAEVAFKLPDTGWGRRWEVVVDTAAGTVLSSQSPHDAGMSVQVVGRGLVLLHRLL
jgi:glycogen operon protein